MRSITLKHNLVRQNLYTIVNVPLYNISVIGRYEDEPATLRVVESETRVSSFKYDNYADAMADLNALKDFMNYEPPF